MSRTCDPPRSRANTVHITGLTQSAHLRWAFAPDGLAAYSLSPIDRAEEQRRALEGLRTLRSTILAAPGLERTVRAWGDNSEKQTDVPAGLAGVVAIAAGAYYSLALRSDGTVIAWGHINLLQANLTDIVAIAAGSSHWLALKRDGTIVAAPTRSL